MIASAPSDRLARVIPARLACIGRVHLDVLLSEQRPGFSLGFYLLQLVVLDTQFGLLTRDGRLNRPGWQDLFVPIGEEKNRVRRARISTPACVTLVAANWTCCSISIFLAISASILACFSSGVR